jgi:predicted nucleotide-binding protein
MRLDEKTLEIIADLICGDNDHPYYRKGRDLPIFFRNAGLKCPDLEYETRKWWVLDRLKEYNADSSIHKVLLRLADPMEYHDNEITKEVIKEMNEILALSGLKININGITPSIMEVDPYLPDQKFKEDSKIHTPNFNKRVSTKQAYKIFISHGNDSAALNLLKEFIIAIGLIPVIVKNEPNKGMSVDDKVLNSLKSCEAAIILATGDDAVNGSEYFQPRQNVIHEIGLAQQILTDKITYLLEEDTKFPSNISPKVYERFTKENLTGAFITIARDLKGFDIL